jgi:uncharacterized membrane protein
MYASPDQYISQSIVDKRPLIVWSIVSVGALVFVGMIIAAPLAAGTGNGYLALTLYQIFSHLCHQIPERSFFIASHQFAVCARCTGLYVGFLAATLCYPQFRSLRRTDTPDRTWLLMASAPLVIDFAMGLLGFWQNTHWSRFSTGALLGSVSVFYVMPGLVELSIRGWKASFGGLLQTSNWRKVFASDSSSDLPFAQSDYSAPHRRI